MEVELFNTSLVDLSITAASATWVLYDYVLTFPDEIQYMWNCRVSPVTLLLFLLRYGALFKQVLLMCQFVPFDVFSETSYAWCNAYIRMRIGMDALVWIVIMTLASLRIFVISVNHSTFKAASVVISGVIFVVLDAYSVSVLSGTQIPAQIPLTGCIRSNAPSTQESMTGAIAEIIAVCFGMLFELLVLLSTGRRITDMKRTLNTDDPRPNVLRQLVRDESPVYLIFLIWNIITIVFAKYNFVFMTIPAVSIAVCRIVFKMRKTHDSSLSRKLPTNNISRTQVLTTNVQLYLSGAQNEDDIPDEASFR